MFGHLLNKLGVEVSGIPAERKFFWRKGKKKNVLKAAHCCTWFYDHDI